MGKGIILRLLEGTEISPELSRTLVKLIPDYRIEYFQDKPNYRRSYQRRIDSLHDAFLFMLDAYPLDSRFTSITAETLKNFVLEVKASCNLATDSVEHLQTELVNFTARLVQIISVCWKWSEGKEFNEAVDCLNDAEQYVLMSRGRYDLATLMPMQTERGMDYILQYDESLPPCSDELITELNAIRFTAYPKTPVWFRSLQEFQKEYFVNLEISPPNVASITSDIYKFIRLWDELKSTSRDIILELRDIDNLSQFSKAQKAVLNVLAAEPWCIDANLILLKDFVSKQEISPAFLDSLDKLPKLPLWYWSLSTVQQSFLAHALRCDAPVEEVVSFLSSRHRTLPAPANFAAHRLFKIMPNEVQEDESLAVKELYGKRFRSAHIGSRDTLKSPLSVKRRHCDSNFSMVMKDAKPNQLCLLQTLISPLYVTDYIPSILRHTLSVTPDLELFKLARSTVQRSKKAPVILQHNHPFNYARYLYYTASDDADSLTMLSTVRDLEVQTPELTDLLNEYQRVLESPIGSATVWDYKGRELFLASLEQVIILTLNGHSYGSCVSGKDRKAVELMHTDAMILYKERYGAWPKFDAPLTHADRINFINIFVDIYMTRHQHEHAGQNAPGADGIKTPDMYLPADIITAINLRLGTEKGVDYDDLMATGNEVKHISKYLKYSFITKNELQCKLTARQLGEGMCNRLYDALSSLISERSRFIKKRKEWGFSIFDTSSQLPAGIAKIIGLIQDKNAGDNNILRMEKIFLEVFNRPVSDDTRTIYTISIYGRIRSIVTSVFEVHNESLDFLANTTVDEWSRLFEESKRANSSVVAC
ncbi:hypothetical protein [Legionella worsleiensis]|uniref:Oxidoreductase n=1 Tax=Legionella worsleiensis TaxID=45076 RepID=A0A0W1AJJ5_9GAMM|nr:hypothetical protein [Legionella worsleiensis]KTD81532.1 oxidoreductase [Legionella worsleiensis]STY32091.1 oxidoreductase [Legionella worsleiensis]